MVGLLSQIFDGLCNNTITVDPMLVDLPDDENHEMHNPDDNHMGHLKLVAEGKKKKKHNNCDFMVIHVCHPTLMDNPATCPKIYECLNWPFRI